MNFTNKVIIVTGGSAGIGAAAAIEFSKAGGDVVIVGRNEEKLNNVAEECTKFGKKPFVIKADISNEEDAKRIINETIKVFEKIDVLVNNAGIVRFGSFLNSDCLKTYDEVMNTNLRAQINLTHLAVPYLITSKGNIVNVSSVASELVSFGESYMLYSTSKAALTYFSRAAAAILAPHGIRVNTVSPGPVDTDILRSGGLDKSLAEASINNASLGRVSEPMEIADIITYLASDKAKGITGSNYIVDNGMLLQNC